MLPAARAFCTLGFEQSRLRCPGRPQLKHFLASAPLLGVAGVADVAAVVFLPALALRSCTRPRRDPACFVWPVAFGATKTIATG